MSSTSLHFRDKIQKETDNLPTVETEKHSHHPGRFDEHCRKRWGRLATVLLYVICISMSAIVLGLYYALAWDPAPKIMTFSEGEIISESTSFVRSVRRG